MSSAFIYRYDPSKPWGHRSSEAPSASCVERGASRKRPKMNKVYLPKKTRYAMRRNAPFRNLQTMTMDCCKNSCLSSISRNEIQLQRQRVYHQDYQSQNLTISSNFKVCTSLNGRSTITYTIPTLGAVCKTAFKKIFGISDKKILVILKKRNIDELTLQRDQRGTHSNNGRRLLPCVVDLVIKYIKNFDPEPSHYRRKFTSKLYFDPKYSLRGIWKAFTSDYPDLKSNRLRKKNKGPSLSYSAFRNIFIRNMSHQYSFRKARVDTCQKCDVFSRKIKDLEKALTDRISSSSKRKKEGRTFKNSIKLKTELRKHLEESEIRYGAIAYDTDVLAASK